MHSHRRSFAVGALMLIAPAASTGTPVEAVAPPAELVATLSPVGSGRIAGLITLKPGKDTTQIDAVLEIRGGTLNDQIPWQIRSGRCGENANIEGAVAQYRRLSVRADGTARVQQTLKMPMPNPATYSVTVSASPNDIETIIACGNLSAR